MRKRFPGTARHITAAKLSRELIEIFARLVLTLAQREFQCRPIPRCFRNFPRQHLQNLLDSAPRAVTTSTSNRPVVNVFPCPPVLDHTGALQLSQVTRNPGLAHPEDLLELGDRKLFLFEKQKQSQTGWIGQEP